MAAELKEAVLIVDDEADILEMISHSLKDCGATVVTASDGLAALEIVRRQPVFLVLSDYRMPGMNGIQLCESVKSEKPLTTCVLLSGFAEREVILKGMRAGVADILEKPVDVPRIPEFVKRTVEKRLAEIQAEREEMEALRLVFLTEAKDLFGDIDKWILRLEEEPLDPAVVDMVFRKAHTLKGSAGTFPGAEVIGKIVHGYENILTKLRSKAISSSPTLVDLLLRGSDLIRTLIEDFAAGRVSDVNPAPWIIEFQRAAEGSISGPESGVAQSKASPAGKPQDGEVAAAKSQTRRPETSEEDSIQVSNEKLVEFMELSGELIVFKNTHGAFLRMLQNVSGAEAHFQAMEDFSHTLEKLSEQFQRQIMEIRKVNLEHAFAKFPRMIRQVAQELKKSIVLRMEGVALGVDKSIAKALAASLVHVIRNSADHGIESPAVREAAGKEATGTISLVCAQTGDYVHVKVSDDGAGIDRERVLAKAISNGLVSQEQARYLSDEEVFEILFMPGFSTAEKITSVSGRGVGMDVVRTEIAKFHGTVRMTSERGRGTLILITIPVPKTVMVENSVLASSGDTLFAIPLTSIDTIASLDDAVSTNVQGMLTCQHKGRTIPVGYYSELLTRGGYGNLVDETPVCKGLASAVQNLVVILCHKQEYLGLRVDAIVEQQEAVIRPFDEVVQRIPGFKGTSILSGDKVAFVVSAEEMVALVRARPAVEGTKA